MSAAVSPPVAAPPLANARVPEAKVIQNSKSSLFIGNFLVRIENEYRQTGEIIPV